MSTPSASLKQWRSEAFWVAGILTIAGVLAYGNTFSVPFLFDDGPAIVDNASIRDLRDFRAIVAPDLEEGVTTKGRPVLNLSFAVNHAIDGTNVRGYHATNLAIHLINGLLIFGISRRFFARDSSQSGVRIPATVLAATVALVWLLHPINTSAVTYVVQRAESLCALFMLLTLFCFLRASESVHESAWKTASLVACAFGMGTKEVMVAAPLIVLLYDRGFISGSFKGAFKSHPLYYALLASTWLILVGLVAGVEGRGTTAGFETVVAPWGYLLTQMGAVVEYLRLVFWPTPLIFDRGTGAVGSLADVWWQAIIVSVIATSVLYCLIRNKPFGFWGAWALLILAPSSSFVPIASQTVAEHRMYLPLVAVIIAVTSAIARVAASSGAVGSFAAVTAIALGILTAERNSDYRSAESIWRDTVAKAPENGRAHINLALELERVGRHAEALEQLDVAIRMNPRSADARFNRGRVLAAMGNLEEARKSYQDAVQTDPSHARSLNNLAALALDKGEFERAVAYSREALLVSDNYADAHANLSAALLEMGRLGEALDEARVAVRADSRSADANFRLGNAFLALERKEEALNAYQRTVEMDPSHADAQNNLANLHAEAGRLTTALAHYERAISAKPRFIAPRANAALILVHLGRFRDAISHYEELTRLAPSNKEFRERLEELKAGGR